METTPEQRAAVRRDECRAHGHSFTEVLSGGTMAPQRVVCSRCGASWRVHPADVSLDFGTSE
jgi:hypothetical protein